VGPRAGDVAARDAMVVAAQIGRTPRGPWRVATRCLYDHPSSIAVAPRLDDGTPFPTLYWLTCPYLAGHIAQAESDGHVAQWATRLAEDPDLAQQMRSADERYRSLRAEEGGGIDACAGVGIAGQADSCATKCLHVHVSARLAGIDDPIGRELLELWGTDCHDRRCDQLAPDTTQRLAAVDIGTVTTRLLIADVTASTITEVQRSTDITHLGEGLTDTGRLSEDAMRRVAAVISRYGEETAARGVEVTTAIATSASRDASNGEEFLGMLEEQGIRPQIITGDREAALSFAGATTGRTGDGLLVVDLGGGSTELVLGEVADSVAHVQLARSLDIGSKRLTEMFLHSDPPTPGELAAARTFAVSALEEYFAQLPEVPTEMISVAGTATTLAAIQLEMAEYDADRIQGMTLDQEELDGLLGMLAGMPLENRMSVTGLHPGRAAVIVAGALILSCVLESSGLERTTVSDHDILYGILLDTYAGRV